MSLFQFSVLDLFKSKGAKRTLSAALAGLAVVLPYFPATAPYAEIVVQVAGYLGIAGITHAAVSK